MSAASKNVLRELVEKLPDPEVPAAVRFLEFLCDHIDQEPLTSEDLEAVARGRADIQEGRTRSLSELKVELGL
jgi:hypothetical protein